MKTKSRNKRKNDRSAAGIDAELLEYIESIRLKYKFLGVDEEQMWSIVLRVQRHYEAELREQKLRYEAQKELLNSEIDKLGRSNNELRHKLIWLIDKIRSAEVAVNEN